MLAFPWRNRKKKKFITQYDLESYVRRLAYVNPSLRGIFFFTTQTFSVIPKARGRNRMVCVL
jgi:hypothetical protein